MVETPEPKISSKLAAGLASVRLPSLGLIPIGVLPAAAAVAARGARLPKIVARAIAWGGLSAVFGLLLGATLNEGEGQGTWTYNTLAVGLWIVSIPVLAGGIYLAWRRPDARKSLIVSMAIATGANAAYFPLDGNPWKQAVGYSCSVLIVLVLAGRTLVGQLASLTLVGALGIYFETRSLALCAALAAGTVLMSRRRRSGWSGVVRIGLTTAALMAVLGIALQSGWFGAKQKDLYIEQTRNTSSLVTGARVESVITTGLAAERVWGYGLGAQVDPNASARMINRVRLQGGDYSSDYFTNSVLSSRVDLHSTAANLWFHAGLVGLGLAAAIGLWIIRAIAGLSNYSAAWRAPCAFIMWMGMWDLLFSPMQQSDRVAWALACAWLVLSAPQGKDDGELVEDDGPIRDRAAPI